jgi:butyrate kinase
MKKFMQLIINPGSTSTKIAVFIDDECKISETLRHSNEELAAFTKVIEQFDFRKKLILNSLQKHGMDINELNAVVGRGGLLRPIQGGTYLINEEMLADLKKEARGSHASNLGGLIAHSIASELTIPSFIVDPVCVDEMEPVARISGMPENPRESLFHALNQKAIARKAAADMGKSYQAINLIVVHLGGGISVGAHCKGRIIDVNNAIPGDGPFSPERSGDVPTGKLVEMCFNEKHTKSEITAKLMGKGGLVAYLGTNDAKEVEKLIKDGNKEAELIYRAMAYQVAKEIGACSAVLSGQVDAVVITGGIAYSNLLVGWITERVKFIAPVMIYPGEDEMEALAAGGLRVLAGKEKAKKY